MVGMNLPPDEVIRDVAIAHGECVLPVLRRVTDRESGQSTVVAMDCGSTLESRRPPCARKAVRLRMAQCTEGWHLAEEPRDATESDSTVPDLLGANHANDEAAQGTQRRVRSTRRLDGMPELPQVPVENRTIGKVFN